MSSPPPLRRSRRSVHGPDKSVKYLSNYHPLDEATNPKTARKKRHAVGKYSQNQHDDIAPKRKPGRPPRKRRVSHPSSVTSQVSSGEVGSINHSDNLTESEQSDVGELNVLISDRENSTLSNNHFGLSHTIAVPTFGPQTTVNESTHASRLTPKVPLVKLRVQTCTALILDFDTYRVQYERAWEEYSRSVIANVEAMENVQAVYTAYQSAWSNWACVGTLTPEHLERQPVSPLLYEDHEREESECVKERQLINNQDNVCFRSGRRSTVEESQDAWDTPSASGSSQLFQTPVPKRSASPEILKTVAESKKPRKDVSSREFSRSSHKPPQSRLVTSSGHSNLQEEELSPSLRKSKFVHTFPGSLSQQSQGSMPGSFNTYSTDGDQFRAVKAKTARLDNKATTHNENEVSLDRSSYYDENYCLFPGTGRSNKSVKLDELRQSVGGISNECLQGRE